MAYLLRVTLPLAWRALWTAILVGFVRAFVDFGATAILARGAATWPIAAFGGRLATLYLGIGSKMAPAGARMIQVRVCDPGVDIEFQAASGITALFGAMRRGQDS